MRARIMAPRVTSYLLGYTNFYHEFIRSTAHKWRSKSYRGSLLFAGVLARLTTHSRKCSKDELDVHSPRCQKVPKFHSVKTKAGIG